MIKITLSILVALTLVLASCKKDNPDPFAEFTLVKLPNAAKNNFVFDSTSYWVLEEITSNVEDSIYLVQSELGIDSATYSDGSPAGIWEYFIVNTVSTLSGDSLDYWSRSDQLVGDDYFSVSRWRVNGTVTGRTSAAIFPFEVGNSGSAPGSIGLVSCTEKLDSLVVTAGTFYDVLKYYDTNNATEGIQPTYYYFASGVGLIRKDLVTSGEIWELNRYEVF